MFCPLIFRYMFRGYSLCSCARSSPSPTGRSRFRFAATIFVVAVVIIIGISYFYARVGAAVAFLRCLALYVCGCNGALRMLVSLLPLTPAGLRSLRPAPASGGWSRSLRPLPRSARLATARSSLSSLRRRAGR